ncbi:MAG: glycosyltransferase [Chromatiaceae bacterium]|mgnify:CR=1 FL=1|nr:glycosyltransferase [Chromatiaceae bacterium]
MHILILPSWYPTNKDDIAGVFFREQAQAIQNAGHQVGVIAYTMLHIKDARRFIFSKPGYRFENDNGVLTYRFTARNYFPKLYRCYLKTLVSHALSLFERYITEHGRPDIIHVHSLLDAGAIAVAIKAKYGIPYVVTEHRSCFAMGKLSAAQVTLAKAATGDAAMRIAVSQPFATALTKMLGEDMPWQIIPNIVEEAFFQSALTTQNHRCFISVCLLHHNKRLDILLQAFKLVKAVLPDVTLRIGGDGPEMAYLKTLAKQLNISAAVEFLGSLNRGEVIQYVSNSSCLVSCSEHETFGVVVAEALALGKPVVATRSGGPEDIVSNGSGLLVEVNDVDALANAMLNILDDYQQYDAAQIRQRCQQRFSAQAVTGRIIDSYTKVLELNSIHG